MQDLTITNINIEPRENKNGLLGWCNFIIYGEYKICSVAIYSCLKSTAGIRLVFPTRESNGKRFKTIFPINKATYEVISTAVSNAYYELMEKMR